MSVFTQLLPFCNFSLLFPAPCSTVTCQLYAKCVLNNDTLGKCVCSNDCPSKPSPVCGTDGRTYVNECHMRFASCTQKANVTVQHVGDCSKFRFYNCVLPDRCFSIPFSANFTWISLRYLTKCNFRSIKDLVYVFFAVRKTE